MEKKENLEELTVKELRVLAFNAGMPKEDTEKFDVKAPLIATINSLRAKRAIEIKKADEGSEKKYTSKKERMRAILMAQPKIRIKIPLIGKEEKGDVRWVFNKKTKREEQVYYGGAYQPVQLNGFKYIVPKGVYTEVPEQVANEVAKADEETSEAGKEFLIDRAADPKDGGGKVADRL